MDEKDEKEKPTKPVRQPPPSWTTDDEIEGVREDLHYDDRYRE